MFLLDMKIYKCKPSMCLPPMHLAIKSDRRTAMEDNFQLQAIMLKIENLQFCHFRLYKYEFFIIIFIDCHEKFHSYF